MTLGRLLHRLSLLLLPALLFAPLIACSGTPSDSPDGACPGWLRSARPVEPPVPENVSLHKAVARAYSIASYYYISGWDPDTALQASLEAAHAEARRSGVTQPVLGPTGSPNPRRFEAYSNAFETLDSAIRGTADEQRIIEAALDGFARSFKDGHTFFLSKTRWEARQRGRIYSAGIHAERSGDRFVITDVLPGSVAFNEGLSPGDVIIKTEPVDEADTTRVLYIDKRLRGEEVTQLRLSLELLPWLKSELVAPQVGHIRLYEFPAYVSCDALIKIRSDLDGAIAGLRAKGARAWVFDFRDNGGGSGETAAIVAATLGFDGLLYTARDNYGRRSTLDIVSENAIARDPLAILINGYSASSSEIVAYVLQDSGRAQIVGTQSRGGVTAARSFELAQGAFFVNAAFIDVGPGNKVLDKIGVTPNQKVALDLDLLQREGRDSQLEAATAYLKQKLGP